MSNIFCSGDVPFGVRSMNVIVDHFFFFQAEDGIRDLTVTGVQTCALPICSLFASDELDVVDEQHIDAPVALAELLALLGPDRIDELVGELLARRIYDALLWMARDHRVTDRVHEMRLPEA